jgi:membrane-bound lytic murein transglycosylase D
MAKSLSRYSVYASALLALSLAGCYPSQPTVSAAAEKVESTAPALSAAVSPAPLPQVTAEQAKADERQQKVSTLIRQVEDAYAKGEANYRKGKLPEAKTEFDRAVDLMLASGIDIRSEARMQEEFERIIDGVNGLEMEALKEGNGFEAKAEPAPADVASDVTFVVDPNLVAKAQEELATTKSDLPLMVNDYVAAFINFFANTQKGHYTLLHSFQRGGRYKAMIERVMAEEGVPQDLIYLAVAESGFNPRAIGPQTRSGGRAGGMWQFMPSGSYGLVRNAYVDERFDPEKSTRAYARYMKFIYSQLGDWYLSMAGYDWGSGNVQRAVQKTGYADFWELYKRNNLPAETKNYVPEILAAIIIANHPTQYGFDDVTLDPPVLTDTVTVNSSVDLHLVSDIVKAPMEEMTALNPSLLRQVTPPDTAFDLHLPAGTAALFDAAIARVPEAKRTAWRYHHVQPGETLTAVAQKYRVAIADLADVNQMKESDPLDGVEALVVPTAPVASPSQRTQMYTARKGDTLVTIADRFGVSLEQLRRWNKLTGFKVESGKRLHVGEAANVPHTARTRRGSALAAHEETGDHAHESPSVKGHATRSQTFSSRHKSSASSGKQASSKTSKQHATTAKPATGAKKSDTPSNSRHAANKSAKKEKIPNAKQKE